MAFERSRIRLTVQRRGLAALAAMLLLPVTAGVLQAPAAAAVRAAGMVDSSYATAGEFTTTSADKYMTGSAVSLDSAGRAVVAGIIKTDRRYGMYVARFTSGGALDTTFGIGGIQTTYLASSVVYVDDLAIDSTGAIVVLGRTSASREFFVAKYSASGVLVTGFGNQGLILNTSHEITEISAVAIDSLDRIVVAGTATFNHALLVRYLPSGAIDASFGIGGVRLSPALTGAGMTIDSANRIVVVGTDTGVPYETASSVARFTASGDPDATFAFTGGCCPAASLTHVIVTGSHIVVAGSGGTGREYTMFTARYTDSGALDTTFGSSGFVTTLVPGIDLRTDALSTDQAGRLILSGTAVDYYQSVPDFVLLRLLPNGTPDPGFGNYADGMSLGLDQADQWGVSFERTMGDAVVDPQGRVVIAATLGLSKQNEYGMLLTRFTSVAPAAPTGVTLTATTGGVRVAWVAATTDGGPAVRAYSVTETPGGATCTTTGATACTVAVSTAGEHGFTVRAVTAEATSEASAAVAIVVVAPTAPPNVTAKLPPALRPVNAITVSWSAAWSAGAPSPLTYVVTSTPASAGCTTAGRTCTVVGLSAGSAYTFVVTAVNPFGAAASAPSPALRLPVRPGRPTRNAGARGHLSALVTWAAPGDGGSAITGYRVVASPGGRACTTTGALRCTVTGLVNGRSYRFTVTATNAVGAGTASVPTAAIVPAPVPGGPTSVRGVRGNGQVALSWAAPAANGTTPILRYRVVANPGGASCVSSAAARRCVVAGLVNGRSYNFTVRALNGVGASPPSGPIAGMPAAARGPARA